jgi:predicted Kef-type K+ transport protein
MKGDSVEYTIIFGSLVLSGYLLGEIAEWIKFPKITGYIIAGNPLRPFFEWLQPGTIIPGRKVITDISLSSISNLSFY